MLRWLVCALTFGLVAILPTLSPAADARKNVVVMVADDLGLQLGCYGDRVVKTPNLDRLAAEGTRFTRAFCTTSSCSASRSVILSGLYNHSTAHYGHEHGESHFRTFDNVVSLPVLLKEVGYRTCSIGKYHLAPEAVYHFDEYANDGVGKDSHNPVGMAVNAKKFIAADDPRPFFLYFCGADPHRAGKGFGNDKNLPGVTPVQYSPQEIVVPPWLPDQPEVRTELAEYYQAISRWDQGVGAVIAALKESGHYDDTLIVCLSDNGPPFPGAKTTAYQPGVKLPLIVRAPGESKPGVVTDAMVTWADLTPTVLDYAGILAKVEQAAASKNATKKQAKKQPDAGPRFHGRSFLSVLSQEHVQGWDQAFLSHTFHEIQMYYPMRTVIRGKHKLIFNVAHQLPYPFASDLYASPTWQGVLTRHDKQYGNRTVEAYTQRARFELYDLDKDPHELVNLAESSEHAELLAELKAKLQQWQKQTKDPWATKWTYE
jgi:N-sulfoglucosamine sulfohydrolase